MKLFRHLDTCLPDYFQGRSTHVWCVPVNAATTPEELFDDIDKDWDFQDSPDDIRGFTHKEYQCALAALKAELYRDPKKIEEPMECFSNIDDDDNNFVYAYFTIEED